MAASKKLASEVKGKLFSLEISQLLRITGVFKAVQHNFSGKTKLQLIQILSQM